MPSPTKSAEGGAVRSLLTLFSKLGRKKKEKQKKHAAQAAVADAGEPKLGSSPQNPVDTEERSDEKVIIPEAILVSEACVSRQEAQAASDELNELTNSAPLEPQQPLVRQDKLLAALESSADQQLTGTRPSFHVADLSSLLFAQRTETQSGNCMALPSRVTDAFASGAQSGEGHVLRRIRTDGHQGSYLPYGTTTVGPMISAVNNANIDSSAISGQNLQDMLYADYEMLDDDRLQTRLERASGRGFVVASGALRREHAARAPHVPSLLGRQPLQPRTTPQLDQLEADWQQRSGAPAEAPVFPSVGPQRIQQPTAEQGDDVVKLDCGSRSEPLGQVQLPHQHLGSDGHRAQPHTQHQERDAVQEQQQQLEMTAPVAGTCAAVATAKGTAADPPQPSPAHPTGGYSGAGGSGSPRFRHVHLHAQHMHPPPHHRSLSPEADAACQGAAVSLELEAPTRSSQPPALQNPQSLPPLPSSSPILTQPVASEHPQQESQVSKGGEGGNDALPPPQPSDQYASAHAHRLEAQAHQIWSGQGPPHPSIQGAKTAEASAGRTLFTVPETTQSGNMGAGLGASNLAGAPPGQDAAQPLVSAAAPSQASPIAHGPGSGAGQIRRGAAPAPAAIPVPGPALGTTAAPGAPAEQSVPLSRPMKLTTACLAAYTTLYDFGADQSFQRALRRKMQLVYKWLHASDLTVPPDPQLEVLPSLAELRPETAAGPSTHKASVSTAPAVRVVGSGRVPPVGFPEVVSRDANSSWMTIPGDHSSGVGDGDGAGSRMLAEVMGGPAAPVDPPAVGSMAGAVAGQRNELAAQWLPSSVREGAGGRTGDGKQDGLQTAPSGPVAELQPSATPPVLQHSYHGSGRVNHHHNSISNTHAHRNPQQGCASEKTYSATIGIAGRPAEGSSGADGPQRHSGWHSMPYSGYDGAQLRPSVHRTLGPPTGVAPPQRGVGTPTPQTAQAAVAGAVTITGGCLQPSQAPHPASLHTQTGGQPLQHSLSDLYGNSSALLAGANLPPRVLAASDDITGVMASPPSAIVPAAAATPPGGSAGHQEHSRVSRSGGGPHPSSSHATGTGAGAVPARTKTIAVASHCPLELQPQSPGSSWSIDDFTLLKKLYEGSLSVVCQAQHKRCGRHVALKIYKRSRLHEMERFQLAREICLHIRIVHPHVVALYATWKDSKYVYLAMDWAPQGNMFDYLVARGGQLSEEEAARVVMRPLMSALAFLHSQHFIHRDVKLENLVLDASCQLKLADFGLAIDQKFEQANTRLGTFGYFAPEVLDCPLKKGPFDLKDTSVPGYDCRVDVWSAGVVAYEVLTGRAPFSASSPAKIIQAIRSRELEFPGVSEEGQDFLRSALTRDPAARPTAKQLLEHPWIVRHCGANAANAAVGSITPSATMTREVTKVTPSPAGWVVDTAGGAGAGGVSPNAAPGAGAVRRGNTGP